jgi:hypothetical protein
MTYCFHFIAIVLFLHNQSFCDGRKIVMSYNYGTLFFIAITMRSAVHSFIHTTHNDVDAVGNSCSSRQEPNTIKRAVLYASFALLFDAVCSCWTVVAAGRWPLQTPIPTNPNYFRQYAARISVGAVMNNIT